MAARRRADAPGYRLLARPGGQALRPAPHARARPRDLGVAGGRRVLRARGAPPHPANFGQVCLKGATVAQTVHAATRLHYPMIRGKCDAPAVVSTAAAVDHVARELARVLQQHGPGAIAFYLSG